MVRRSEASARWTGAGGGGARRGWRGARMRAGGGGRSPARALSGAPVCPVDSRARANILYKPKQPKITKSNSTARLLWRIGPIKMKT